MSWVIKVGGVDRSNIIQPASIRLGAQAHNGEGSQGGVNLDDDAAANVFPALKVLALTETASGSEVTLARTRVSTKEIGRGDVVHGDARRFDVSADDSHWDLRKLRVHEWARGAETDVARVTALGAYILNGVSSTVTNATKRASTVVDVSTYVPNTATVTMPAHTYDSQDPWGVLDDCARSSGKAWFIIVKDDGTMALFYAPQVSTIYASTLSITDSSPNLTTSYPPIWLGAAGTQEADELISGLGMVYGDGQMVIVTDATAVSTHDVAEETVWDGDAETSGAATTRAQTMLDNRKIEELRYRLQLQLPAAKAHLIKAGMMISFRAAAAAVLTPVTLRVARCYYSFPDNGDVTNYVLDLELGYPEKMGPRIADRGRAKVIARQIAKVAGGGSGGEAVVDETVAVVMTYYQIKTTNGVLTETVWNADIVTPYFQNPAGGGVGAGIGILYDESFARCWPNNDAFKGVGKGYGGIIVNLASVVEPTTPLGLKVTLNWVKPAHSLLLIKTDGPAIGTMGRDDGLALTPGRFEVRALAPGALVPADIYAGTAIAEVGGSDTGSSTFTIPANYVTYGSANGAKLIIAPLFDVLWAGSACKQSFSWGGIESFIAFAGTSSAVSRSASGAGWVEGGLIGTRNGSNTSFTLKGTALEVSDVYWNGVPQSSSAWSFNDVTGTLTTVGWAPIASDLLEARYRI